MPEVPISRFVRMLVVGVPAIVTALVLAGLPGAASAAGSEGALVQKPGLDACASETEARHAAALQCFAGYCRMLSTEEVLDLVPGR